MLPELECHRGSLPIATRDARRRREIGRTPQGFLAALLCLALSLVSVGCSGNLSSSTAKAGAISSGKTGAVTELAVLGALPLSMTPSNDTLNAGVDWIVTCGGNPVTGNTTGGACGTLVPAHTADGATTVYTAPSVVPINQTVTITATVTSNPSQSSSLTFTIVSSSIAVSISVNNQTVTTLQTNQSAYVWDTVVNDPLNAGVTWTATCGSAACGTFSSPTGGTFSSPTGGTYTAPSAVPAGNTVTLTATSVTDTSKSAFVTLTIVAPTPAPVTVSVVPGSLYLDIGSSDSAHRAQLTAIVANDSSNAGVTWSESCSSLITSACGSLGNVTSTTVTYIAPTSIPTGGTVTITARSVANPSITSNPVTANIVNGAPITLSLSPVPPAKLAAESSLSLSATTTDPNQQGVDWSVACASAGACGSFTSLHTAEGAQNTYTAPSNIPTGGKVFITASPTSTPSYPTVSAVTIVSTPQVSLTQTPSTPMTAGTQATVSATVAYDSTNSGVSWTVCSGSSTTPSDCGDSIYGYVYPPQTASGAPATYTAPPVLPGTSLVIQATSVAASTPSIQSGSIAISSAITIQANTTPSISFIPSLPAKVQPNATINLMAAVANDSTGVDWQLCGDGCGYFTISPAVPEVAATSTTAYQAPIAAKVTTSVSGWPSGTPLPYTAPPQIPASGIATITATAHVDSTKAVSGTIAIATDATGPALHGKVVTGTTQLGITGTAQPVAGSSVALYVAGTNGSVYKLTSSVVEIEYSVQATQITSTTTGKDGSFTIPAGYTCPSTSSQMYLVATGGIVGTNKIANANLALMTALGSCSNLSSTSVVVNEVTTIASAFAIGPFTANDALYGTSSYLFLGTSASNTTGLINAFASVNNLVDITTGLTRPVTPAGNGTVPYAYINYLADILNACAVTAGGGEGDGSACGTLFSGTDVMNVAAGGSSLGYSAAPTDTLQAVFNLAQVARYNAGYAINNGVDSDKPDIWSLATTASPFQPIQTLGKKATANAIAIHYTSGGGISSASAVGSLAVDASGNVWITDSNAGTVAEWSAVGAPAVGAQVPTVLGNTFAESPFATVSGGGPMAIDASGNLWVSGDGKLAEITSNGTQAPGSPFKGVAGGGSDMAIDKQGNIWLANYSSLVEFDSTGAFVSPASGFVYKGVNYITDVTVDSSNNIWAAGGILTNPGGNLIVGGGGGGSSRVLSYSAPDGQGDMWSSSGPCKEPPYAGNGEEAWMGSISCFTYNGAQGTQSPGVEVPGGIALDGRGTAWVSDRGFTNQNEPSGLASPELFAAYPGGAYQYVPSASLGAGPLSVAIDGSGNIWVLLSDNTVTEFVGEATPVVAPVALGLKNNKLATMP